MTLRRRISIWEPCLGYAWFRVEFSGTKLTCIAESKVHLHATIQLAYEEMLRSVKPTIDKIVETELKNLRAKP